MKALLSRVGLSAMLGAAPEPRRERRAQAPGLALSLGQHSHLRG